jgi:tetratricopeptide (TPR) repeat protein
MRNWLGLLLGLLSAPLFPLAAAGEPEGMAPAPALRTETSRQSDAEADSQEARLAQAKHLFEQGAARHEAGEYGLAVADFEAAYALSHAPLLLFNMAQSLRLAGNCRLALAAYQKYLAAVPAASNRDKVEQWIAELDACAAEAKAASPTGATPSPPARRSLAPVPPVPPAPAPPPKTGRVRRLAGLALLGAGVATASGAGYFALVSHRAEDDLRDHHQTSAVFLDQATYDRGARAAVVARVLGVVSLGAVIGGAVLILSDRREAASAPPTAGGGLLLGFVGGPSLGWQGSF